MNNLSFNLRSPSAISIACAAAFATFNPSAVRAQTPNGSATQLPSVVITASRMEQALETSPIGATVLLGDDIRASGVLDANEAVRKLGGVAARSDLNGGREFSLDLRGNGEASSQNLVVVVDGIRITQNDLASARLSSISPEIIERIEIIRGGASVMWGEGGAGGVISVTTKSGATKGLSGSAAIGAESFGGKDVQANVNIAGDQGNASVNVRQYLTDGYRDNSANEQTVYALAAGFKSGAFKTRLAYSNEKQDARFPGPIAYTQFLANPRQTVTPLDSGFTNEARANAGLDYTAGGMKLSLDVGNRKRESKFDAATGSFPYFSKIDSTSTQISPRVSYTTDINGIEMASVMGYDRFKSKAHNEFSYGVDEQAQQTNSAWYANTQIRLTPQTRLSLGARDERFDKAATDSISLKQYAYRNQLSAWDIALNQTVANGVNVYGRAAKSYRLPNIDENRIVLNQLRPTLARDFELGAKYRQNNNSAVARLFRQTSIDEIAFDSNLYANINQDAIKRTGVELEGTTQLNKHWDLSANLQSIRAVFTNGTNLGKRVPLVSDLTLTTRIGYAIDAQHRIEMSALHRSASFPGTDTANTCSNKVPSTTYLNASYSFKSSVDGKGWSILAGVNNLTNQSSYSYAFPFYSCPLTAVYSDAERSFNIRAKLAF